jgi:hypothetical protein
VEEWEIDCGDEGGESGVKRRERTKRAPFKRSGWRTELKQRLGKTGGIIPDKPSWLCVRSRAIP